MDTIHKIVAWVTSPFGILFLGLGFAWVVRRWKVLSRVCVGAVLVLTWVMGCSITSRLIGLPLEMDEVEVEVEKAGGGGVDAIVLLGGGMGIHEKCGRAELFGGADRAWLAARLWKRFAGQVPMTVSGSGAPAELMFLADMGVDTNKVLVLDQAKNTEDEAKLVNELVVSGPLLVASNRTELTTNDYQLTTSKPRVLLVSSAWHLPRARVLFERAGFDVTPAPTDFEMHFAAEEPIRVNDFFPNAESLSRNSYALKEWVARFCYWIKR